MTLVGLCSLFISHLDMILGEFLRILGSLVEISRFDQMAYLSRKWKQALLFECDKTYDSLCVFWMVTELMTFQTVLFLITLMDLETVSCDSVFLSSKQSSEINQKCLWSSDMSSRLGYSNWHNSFESKYVIVMLCGHFIKIFFKRGVSRKFPGGSVVRAQLFHSWGLGSITGRGTKIPQA